MGGNENNNEHIQSFATFFDFSARIVAIVDNFDTKK